MNYFAVLAENSLGSRKKNSMQSLQSKIMQWSQRKTNKVNFIKSKSIY